MALDILPLLEAEAKERQGTRTDITEKIPESAGESREKAAELVGSNPRYVPEAKSQRPTESPHPSTRRP